MPSSNCGVQEIEGGFDLANYTETLARCGSAGRRNLLKALAFPYLYGATMTATIRDQHEAKHTGPGPAGTRNRDDDAEVRRSSQPSVSGQARPGEAGDTDERTGDDRVTLKYLRFGTARISELMLSEFEYLRINDAKQTVELGCDGVIFESPQFSDFNSAVACFNQTWGLLSQFLDLQG